MSENELLHQWTSTRQLHYLNKLIERLYKIGEEKLSDNVSKDILHNSILKIHKRLQDGSDIHEIKSFFLKSLYNAVIDHYKASDRLYDITDNISTEINEKEELDNLDLIRLKKLEYLVRTKQVGKARTEYLLSVLQKNEKKYSRQSKFFHRQEIKKSLSLIHVNEIKSFFPYEKRVLKEVEDTNQTAEIQRLYLEAKKYKHKALKVEAEEEWSESEIALLKLLDFVIALQLYKEASALNPDYFKARFNIGFCHYQLENYEDSVKEFEAVIHFLEKRSKQSNYAVKMGSTWRNIGTIYLLKLNRFHQSLNAFEQALLFTPDDKEVRLGILFSACKLNDIEMANIQLKQMGSKKEIKQSIIEWIDSEEQVKDLTFEIYKENRSLRNYIPIENII